MAPNSYQMAVGENEVFGETVEGLETICQLVTRCAIREVLYMGRSTPARDELEMALIRLYKEVLVYLLKATHYFQTSTASTNIQ